MTHPANRPDPAGDAEDFLVAQIEKLLVENAALKALIEGQQARIAELERRHGLDSSNSSKPPSSDGPKGGRHGPDELARAVREAWGGQKGHPGETLRQVMTPDVVIDHYPASCAGCGTALTPGDGHYPMPRGKSLTCQSRIHRRSPSIAPMSAPACGAASELGRRSLKEWRRRCQYGPRICAMVVYLLHGHFVPEDRLAELMRDLFSVSVVPATTRPDEPLLRPSAEKLCRCGAPGGVPRQGQAYGRDGLSSRQQDPMAAHRLDGSSHLLSRLRQTRQPAGRCGRHRGARSLEALLHDDRRAAWLVQRSSSAGT